MTAGIIGGITALVVLSATVAAGLYVLYLIAEGFKH